ncbi:ribonuclease HII [Halorubrum californiense DSM 19288]|uniref:Ribonuclease n=1 Tax=Halorubrum californiense DSM 19288 TaxID=1227465 RepID=M0EGV3_9EURY|nr:MULTISPECIES: ribonuclease HII [Halorubrum]ELZ46117.1 ribonuclease HII [Halorubrum californiense DSM 19288]TKX67792.1 ribonuclease HII [Halorubrum sp. GN11GM_10-3_MGM]
MYLGVDEAGKGPALGPMAAAAVIADPTSLPADVDDSKRIAPARREEMATALRDDPAVAVGVARVEPTEIDRPDTDMNTLTVRGQARAVRDALADRPAETAEPVRVVADAGDTSEERFAERLVRFVEGDDADESVGDGISLPAVDVTAAHGADGDDPVVGAASVVAKTVRDAAMADIDAAYPDYDDLGSGYPSDPATRSFLAAYVGDHETLPDCARTSWSTCEDALAAAEQSALDEF